MCSQPSITPSLDPNTARRSRSLVLRHTTLIQHRYNRGQNREMIIYLRLADDEDTISHDPRTSGTLDDVDTRCDVKMDSAANHSPGSVLLVLRLNGRDELSGWRSQFAVWMPRHGIPIDRDLNAHRRLGTQVEEEWAEREGRTSCFQAASKKDSDCKIVWDHPMDRTTMESRASACATDKR